MWETPFDESMLAAQPGVAIYCPEDHHAEELFEVLRRNGLAEHWGSGIQWDRVYCVSGKSLKCCGKLYVETVSSYRDYIRCTFFGTESTDFDAATDDELRALFGM